MRGMTLLEVMITTGIFALITLVSYNALYSSRNFTNTNVSEVDMQESARKALELITDELTSAGSVTEGAVTFPLRYKFAPLNSADRSNIPADIDAALLPTSFYAKGNPDRPLPKGADEPSDGTSPGVTGASDFILFKKPLFDVVTTDGDAADNLPNVNVATGQIDWENITTSIFIETGPNNVNQLVLKRKGLDSTGAPVFFEKVLCRHIDRMIITGPGNDLTITLILSRRLSTDPNDTSNNCISVALRGGVTLRN